MKPDPVLVSTLKAILDRIVFAGHRPARHILARQAHRIQLLRFDGWLSALDRVVEQRGLTRFAPLLNDADDLCQATRPKEVRVLAAWGLGKLGDKETIRCGLHRAWVAKTKRR